MNNETRRVDGICNCAFLSAAVILAITGIAKVWSAFGSAKSLAAVDPVIGIRFGQLMLLVGLVEIGIALVCFFGKRRNVALGLVAWISTNFVVYRVGLWWMDWHHPCNCMGNLTDALHITPHVADHIMKVVLAYLLISSYGVLLWQWRKGRRRCRSNERPAYRPASRFFLPSVVLCVATAGMVRAAVVEDGMGKSKFIVVGTYFFETFQLYSHSPPAWNNEGTFRVVIHDCRWRISLQPKPASRLPHPPLVVKELVAVFDGTTIYEFYSVSPPPDFKGKNVDRAQLVNGPIPQRLDQRIQHVWLGLAAGCFFRSNAPGYHPRLGLPPEDYERHDNFRLVYTDWSGPADNAWTPSWVAARGGEAADKSAKPSADGETNLFLSVPSWTNLANLKVAGAFQVTEFFSKRPSVQTTCRVTSIIPDTDASISVPALSSETYITDRRLTSQPPHVPVQFVLNQWPSLDYSRNVFAGLKAAGVFATPTKGARNSKRTALLTVMAASALALSLLAWRARKKQQAQ